MKLKTYQPKKAELEEPFVIRKADGTMPTPEEVARVAVGQVKVVEGPEAYQRDWNYSL